MHANKQEDTLVYIGNLDKVDLLLNLYNAAITVTIGEHKDKQKMSSSYMVVKALVEFKRQARKFIEEEKQPLSLYAIKEILKNSNDAVSQYYKKKETEIMPSDQMVLKLIRGIRLGVDLSNDYFNPARYSKKYGKELIKPIIDKSAPKNIYIGDCDKSQLLVELYNAATPAAQDKKINQVNYITSKMGMQMNTQRRSNILEDWPTSITREEVYPILMNAIVPLGIIRRAINESMDDVAEVVPPWQFQKFNGTRLDVNLSEDYFSTAIYEKMHGKECAQSAIKAAREYTKSDPQLAWALKQKLQSSRTDNPKVENLTEKVCNAVGGVRL